MGKHFTDLFNPCTTHHLKSEQFPPSERPHRPSLVTNLPDSPKPLSTEGSIIPGETEEDGALRREYVLVGDKRALDFNKAVDGIPP